MAQDILLDDDNDLYTNDGDFVIGESTLQEVGLLLGMNEGNLLHDPLTGPGLMRLINSKANATEIRTLVKQHLARDGKDFDQIKEFLKFNGQAL